MAKGSRQVPSVGRRVHYRALGSTGGQFPAGVCRSADITEVDRPGDPESPVGLGILNPTGLHFAQGVQFGDAPGNWHWPEYVPDVKP